MQPQDADASGNPVLPMEEPGPTASSPSESALLEPSAKDPIPGGEDPSRTSASAPTAERVWSIDAYRGLVMLLMVGEAFRFGKVAEKLPDHPVWTLLAHHQAHAPWRGCSLHDLIQPSFSFLVGVALPWSIANRRARGHSVARMFGHTLWRALLLIGLGIWLRSVGAPSTRFTFEDTLTQIGLGYAFLWILAWARPMTQWITLAGILVGYWLLFALSPLPAPDFDPTTVGVPTDWEHWMSGFAGHWNKNIHPAHAFDVWFLNLFPRETPFLFNRGGYVTLSFIPTLATMILGLLAGQWLREERIRSGAIKVFGLVLAGCFSLMAGMALDTSGICPSVKKIWTPSWVLYSGGFCALFLAAFHAVLDVARIRFWSLPLLVVGANSIFTYVVAHLWEDFLKRDFRTHLGSDTWETLFGPIAPVWEGGAVVLVVWLCCLWLWRHRVFIRI
jgi:heparan-alpha-glucosaminide N-acetyltransferase